MYHYSIIISLFILLFSCGSNKKLIPISEVADPNPKLIFLNYTVSKNTKGKKHIIFNSKKIAEGKLKSYSSKYINNGTIGDLVCLQLDKNKTPITKQIIKNPLIKSIEYINDSLKYEMKQVRIEKSTLGLRLQLKHNCQFIEIIEIIDSLQNTSPIIITKIN